MAALSLFWNADSASTPVLIRCNEAVNYSKCHTSQNGLRLKLVSSVKVLVLSANSSYLGLVQRHAFWLQKDMGMFGHMSKYYVVCHTCFHIILVVKLKIKLTVKTGVSSVTYSFMIWKLIYVVEFLLFSFLFNFICHNFNSIQYTDLVVCFLVKSYIPLQPFSSSH